VGSDKRLFTKPLRRNDTPLFFYWIMPIIIHRVSSTCDLRAVWSLFCLFEVWPWRSFSTMINPLQAVSTNQNFFDSDRH